MKQRCKRCQALIEMEQSGMMFHADLEEAFRLWYRECPFCGKENHYEEEMK